MTRPGFPFSTSFRVRYSEIDGQKIVFNSRYLEYGDVALTEFWRWADLKDIGPDWLDAEFNVVRATVDYKRSFRFDDMVQAYVRVSRVGVSSLTMQMDLCHGDTGDLHARLEIVSAHVDLHAKKAKPIPESVRARLSAMRG